MLITFDTQQVVKKLRTHGFTEEQADVLTEIQKQIIHDSIDSTLASKGDINTIRNEAQEVKVELKNDISLVRSELIVVKWMLGIVIAAEVLPLLKQFL